MVDEREFAIGALNVCSRRARFDLEDLVGIEIGVFIVIRRRLASHIEKEKREKNNGKFSASKLTIIFNILGIN